jgi:uncharacterized protein (UPF0147 family)
MTNFNKVENAMRYLQEDSGTPRSVREKLGQMINYLKSSHDDSTKISTVLSQLEELSSDVNIPDYVRTQLYSISAMLEQVDME